MFKAKDDVLIASPRKKLAADTVLAPTIKFSAFSARPRYFKTPAPVTSAVLRLYPGLKVVKPSILVFGVNEFVVTIAAGFPEISICKIL